MAVFDKRQCQKQFSGGWKQFFSPTELRSFALSWITLPVARHLGGQLAVGATDAETNDNKLFRNIQSPEALFTAIPLLNKKLADRRRGIRPSSTRNRTSSSGPRTRARVHGARGTHWVQSADVGWREGHFMKLPMPPIGLAPPCWNCLIMFCSPLIPPAKASRTLSLRNSLGGMLKRWARLLHERIDSLLSNKFEWCSFVDLVSLKNSTCVIVRHENLQHAISILAVLEMLPGQRPVNVNPQKGPFWWDAADWYQKNKLRIWFTSHVYLFRQYLDKDQASVFPPTCLTIYALRCNQEKKRLRI